MEEVDEQMSEIEEDKFEVEDDQDISREDTSLESTTGGCFGFGFLQAFQCLCDRPGE